jgi:predicted Zn-dependent peptidase
MLAAFPWDGAPWDKVTAAAEVLLAAASDGKDSPLVRALTDRGVKTGVPTLSIERRRAPWSTVVLDTEVPLGTEPSSVLDAVCVAVRSTRAGGDARARVARVLARTESDAVIARDQIHYFAMLRSSSILGSPKGFVDGDAPDLSHLSPADWDLASARLVAGLASIRARLVGPGVSARRLSFAPSPAATAPADPTRAARSGALSNGLRYVVRESSDSDVFALHLLFAPRAAGEPVGREGITDLLHRVMARATIVHDQAALEERLSRLGARVKVVDDPSVPFDDYYTTPEFSWLRLEVPAANWRDAVGLVAEMVRFPSLTQDALDDARHDMRERVQRRDGSPREAAIGALDGLLAPGHPLTKPVYGTEASLAAMTLADLTSYHAGFVTGRRAMATVVGPIGADEVVRALQSDFGGISAGDAPAATERVPGAQPSASTELKLGKSQAYLAMASVLDVPPEDRAALAIAVAMLSDRLAFDLRETKGLAYSIGASLRPWGGRTRFEVAMGTRADNVDAARAGILDDVRAFRTAAPTESEVARAVNVARGAALMRRMTRISLAYEAGIELLRGENAGDERTFVDSLRDVRADAVKRVSAAYLDPGRLAVAIVR